MKDQHKEEILAARAAGEDFPGVDAESVDSLLESSSESQEQLSELKNTLSLLENARVAPSTERIERLSDRIDAQSRRTNRFQGWAVAAALLLCVGLISALMTMNAVDPDDQGLSAVASHAPEDDAGVDKAQNTKTDWLAGRLNTRQVPIKGGKAEKDRSKDEKEIAGAGGSGAFGAGGSGGASGLNRGGLSKSKVEDEGRSKRARTRSDEDTEAKGSRSFGGAGGGSTRRKDESRDEKEGGSASRQRGVDADSDRDSKEGEDESISGGANRKSMRNSGSEPKLVDGKKEILNAAKNLGYSPFVPTELPAGYTFSSAELISREDSGLDVDSLYVTYNKGEESLVVWQARGDKARDEFKKREKVEGWEVAFAEPSKSEISVLILSQNCDVKDIEKMTGSFTELSDE